MQTVLTADEKETELVGRKLGEKLRGGEVIALDGDLGAGKTIFTKGIAQGTNAAVRKNPRPRRCLLSNNEISVAKTT